MGAGQAAGAEQCLSDKDPRTSVTHALPVDHGNQGVSRMAFAPLLDEYCHLTFVKVSQNERRVLPGSYTRVRTAHRDRTRMVIDHHA